MGGVLYAAKSAGGGRDDGRGFCIMVALSIYTDHFHWNEKNGWYGWSYIMAWFGWLLTLFTGIMYIILRKRAD
ncbi:hypothetical protein QQF64_000766 [Cirrhinus molitorella]|uniref:Uncharacterized protein n=1 Tax=Cirrhinus molitorella TaxID=172907 RepID=A0ABR3NZ41_9TELE